MSTNERNIKTMFYRGKKVVRTNSSVYAFNAVPNAVKHMQVNEYHASHVEVFDATVGTLHAVITRSVKGTITIVFKRAVKEGV